ncbi:hypothetical protein A8H40_06595 [Burkholderia multivorans]|uniref:Uncharacterized protein n=1 Tax=Burkholderia multivorans CGD2 TaxID=513052 RepID=B9BI53_9BURK|nr:hypothetical protein A8H40_06595 [Burkholderia multivorans]EEE09386.1 hypothetical protein BURMUCGD2_4759 [Burkholderia multivorans CGD2]EEE15304.1 hypothetical protein BURMUCGD2M_4747 [Burkholderia multivorans CGD2M]EJO63093.1 hypothetical protein BURMUCF1_A0766 [Burkholderia multivorans ATCC BAA-247]PRE24863.1 hypothetical protein C6P92_08385 [Burkholderia multivorans]
MLLTPSCQEQGTDAAHRARCARSHATRVALAYRQQDFVGQTRHASAADAPLLSRCRALDFEA